jgi:predicted small lipoprotein YifL
MMKSTKKITGGKSNVKNFILSLFAFVFILSVLITLVVGCGFCKGPGETASDARRRHKRVVRTNTQEMMDDIDKALLLDKPSKLNDKRIP